MLSDLRPAFRADTLVISDFTKPDFASLKKRNKGEDLDMVGIRTASFVREDPIGRRVPSFDALRKLQVQREGIKIQLGPETLDKFFSIEVRDPKNPRIKIRKTVGFSEMLQKATDTSSGIKSAIRELDKLIDQRSSIALQQQNDLKVMLTRQLQDLENLTAEQVDVLRQGLNVAKTDPSWIAHNPSGPFFVKGEDLNADLLSQIMLWTLTNVSRADRARPVNNIEGIPITVLEMENQWRDGHVLDVQNKEFITREDLAELIRRSGPSTEEKDDPTSGPATEEKDDPGFGDPRVGQFFEETPGPRFRRGLGSFQSGRFGSPGFQDVLPGPTIFDSPPGIRRSPLSSFAEFSGSQSSDPFDRNLSVDLEREEAFINMQRRISERSRQEAFADLGQRIIVPADPTFERLLRRRAVRRGAPPLVSGTPSRLARARRMPDIPAVSIEE